LWVQVKESAIATMGLIIAHIGDKLQPQQLSSCLPVLLERLRNETTRITALKSFSTIAQSSLKVDLSSVCNDTVLECSTFLRKNDRALKQAALTTLDSIVTNYAANIKPDLYENVARELAPLISDTELHLTHLSLKLCESMVRHSPASIALMQKYILLRATALLQSPLLQGTALLSCKKLFSTLAASNQPGCSFSSLLDQLMGIVHTGNTTLSRQSLQSVAQCVSSLCSSAGKQARDQTVSQFMKDLSNPASSEQVGALLLVYAAI
jgi:cullin-associated NEDD8-dissociated protein 1